MTAKYLSVILSFIFSSREIFWHQTHVLPDSILTGKAVQSEWKTLKMWIPRQTPCSLHPVSQARPHPWGYYQITLWTAYRDDSFPKGDDSQHKTLFLKNACGHSSVDVQTYLPYSCPYWSLSKMNSLHGLQMSFCSQEDYDLSPVWSSLIHGKFFAMKLKVILR